MGVKETPMVPAQEDPANAQEASIEDTPAEESTTEEVGQIIEAKPKKRAAPKKAPAAKKAPKKKEAIDLKQRTICPMCKCNLSMHALLYTHSCTREALQKKKVAPVFDENIIFLEDRLGVEGFLRLALDLLPEGDACPMQDAGGP